MRQDADGANYYLITAGDGCAYEYKTDAANRIGEMRIYRAGRRRLCARCRLLLRDLRSAGTPRPGSSKR
jgi:hypothetical protein